MGLWGDRREGRLRGGRLEDCGDSRLRKKRRVQEADGADRAPSE